MAIGQKWPFWPYCQSPTTVLGLLLWSLLNFPFIFLQISLRRVERRVLSCIPIQLEGLLSDKEEVDTVHCAGLQHCWSLSCCTSLLWLSLVIFIFVLSNYIVHVLHVTAIAWSQILSRKLSSVLWYCNRIPILIENIINRISYIRTTMYVIYFRWKHCSGQNHGNFYPLGWP